jgi:hypothetical protein
VRIGFVEEDGGVPVAAGWAGADPVTVGPGEAEVRASVVALETAVGEDGDATVASRVCHEEVALAEVDRGGFVRDEVVL